MADLSEIPGIGAASLELLAVTGIHDAEHLAVQNPDALVAELKKANEALSIVRRSPGKATVEKWIWSAHELCGHTGANTGPRHDAGDQPVPVNYEGNPQVKEMLTTAPFAVPLPGKQLMEKQLRVGDIPAGLLLNRYSGDLDVRIGEKSEARPDFPERRPPGNAERVSTQARQTHFDSSNVRTITADREGFTKRIPASKGLEEEDRVSLIRSPREKTNRGKDPNSRRYVRGVLHTHPWNLRLGAFFSLLLLVNLPLAVASAFLLLLSREYPETFYWVPKWSLAFPIALPFLGIAYLIWGFSGKCRICTQKLFVHKGALKHMKAHRLPGMGYVVPLCLHLLLFSWFRCSSCGTPVRLKK